MWRDKNGDPTYKVSADGTVDWYTFSGFRRYNSECYRLPRPRWGGLIYAPALANSLKTIGYAEFFGIVTSAASRTSGPARKRSCRPLPTTRM